MTSIRHPHTGALFLVMSNGITATVDATAKYMSPSLHAVQVVWGYSLAITVLVLGYAAIRPDLCRRAFATRRPWLQFGRGAMLFGTISMLFMALASMPLADVIAISFAARCSSPFSQRRCSPNGSECIASGRWWSGSRESSS